MCTKIGTFVRLQPRLLQPWICNARCPLHPCRVRKRRKAPETHSDRPKPRKTRDSSTFWHVLRHGHRAHHRRQVYLIFYMGLFYFIFIFSTVNSRYVHEKFLLMTRLEQWTSGIWSNHSANWAKITFQSILYFYLMPDLVSFYPTGSIQTSNNTKRTRINPAWQKKQILWNKLRHYHAKVTISTYCIQKVEMWHVGEKNESFY